MYILVCILNFFFNLRYTTLKSMFKGWVARFIFFLRCISLDPTINALIKWTLYTARPVPLIQIQKLAESRSPWQPNTTHCIHASLSCSLTHLLAFLPHLRPVRKQNWEIPSPTVSLTHYKTQTVFNIRFFWRFTRKFKVLPQQTSLTHFSTSLKTCQEAKQTEDSINYLRDSL